MNLLIEIAIWLGAFAFSILCGYIASALADRHFWKQRAQHLDKENERLSKQNAELRVYGKEGAA